VHEEAGGHSTVWIQRAQIEGCTVFAAGSPTEFNQDSFNVKSEYLDFPVGEILAS